MSRIYIGRNGLLKVLGHCMSAHPWWCTTTGKSTLCDFDLWAQSWVDYVEALKATILLAKNMSLVKFLLIMEAVLLEFSYLFFLSSFCFIYPGHEIDQFFIMFDSRCFTMALHIACQFRNSKHLSRDSTLCHLISECFGSSFRGLLDLATNPFVLYI